MLRPYSAQRPISSWGHDMPSPFNPPSITISLNCIHPPTSSTATSSPIPNSSPRPFKAANPATLAPSSKFRTAATIAAPSASSLLFAADPAVFRQIKSSAKSKHLPNLAPAKSCSPASTLAPTAEIFLPALNSSICSAASWTKLPSNASASAPSSLKTSPRTLSNSSPAPAASPSISTCPSNPPPTASSPPCTAGIAPSTTPAASNSSATASLTPLSAPTSSPAFPANPNPIMPTPSPSSRSDPSPISTSSPI